MFVAEPTQLTGDAQALLDSLRAHKVLGHFDAAGHVSHLVRRACRNEDGVAEELDDRERLHAVAFLEQLDHARVNVVDLVVDGVAAGAFALL